MANVKVSALPTAATLVSTDKFVVDSGGGTPVTSTVTLSSLKTQLAYQPYNANLDTFAAIAPSNVGKAALAIDTPTANSYPKVGTSGNITLETAAQLKTTIDAQSHSTNLDTFATVAPSGLGLGFIRITNAVAPVYFKCVGDVDQTLQQVTPTTLAEELRLFLVQPRPKILTSSATPTPDVDTTDIYILTALAAAADFKTPTGSPANGQQLVIRIRDNGVQRNLTYQSIYKSLSPVLPVITVVGVTHYLTFRYNTVTPSWDCVEVASVTV